MFRALLSVVSIASLLAFAAPLQGADSPDNKLREQLRNTMLQLRKAEDDLSTLQATQPEKDAKVASLTKDLEVMTNKESDEKAASTTEIANLKTQLDKVEADLAATKSELEKKLALLNQAVAYGNGKEAERVKLAGEVVMLNRKVADREAKNLELFRTGNEILTRYEKFGLGQSLAAREPFTGLARVKLENQVQGYQDKLIEQKIHPGAEAAAAAAAGASQPAATPAPTAAPPPAKKRQ